MTTTAPKTIEAAQYATHEQPARHFFGIADHLACQAAFRSSAEICVTDARKALEQGKWERALFWSQRSLSYSVGKGSSVYILANEAWQAAENAAADLRAGSITRR